MSAPQNSRQQGSIRLYDYNGRSVPSVTSILSAIDKPALRGWYAKQTAAAALDALLRHELTADVIVALTEEARAAHEATKYHQERHKKTCDFVPNAASWLAGAPTRTRDTAGARGTAVHEAAEKDFDLLDVPENARAAYGSYQQWVAEFEPTILAKEFQVFNGLDGYAGSGDLMGIIPWLDPEDVWLIDIKTSRSLFHEMRLQLRGYADGEFCIKGNEVDEEATQTLFRVNRFAILHLTDDGYEFVEVTADGYDSEVFRAALAILNWIGANDGKSIGTIIRAPIEAAA